MLAPSFVIEQGPSVAAFTLASETVELSLTHKHKMHERIQIEAPHILTVVLLGFRNAGEKLLQTYGAPPERQLAAKAELNRFARAGLVCVRGTGTQTDPFHLGTRDMLERSPILDIAVVGERAYAEAAIAAVRQHNNSVLTGKQPVASGERFVIR